MNLSVCSPDCLPITITSVELQLQPGAETSTVLDTAATALVLVTSAANRLIGEVVQSQRRPLLVESGYYCFHI